MKYERVHPFLLRALVLALPIAGILQLGPAIDANPAVDTALQILLWGSWMLCCIAALAPHPIGLTYLRIAAVGYLVTAAWALPHETSVASIAIVIAFAVATAMNQTSTWCVNGLSYPNEKRFCLRPPAPVLLGPLALAALAVVAAPAAVLYLWGSDRESASVITALVSIPIVFILLRAMHGLSKRWIVFVPAGVVVHDPISLVDPVLFLRNVIDRFGPAAADTDALDLTQNALGHSIELDLFEKVPMVLSKPGGTSEAGASARLMIAPTNPARVMQEARSRRIPT